MVIMDDKFCKRCGIKINKGFLGDFGGDKCYVFSDGVYCESCAKLKVAKARGKKSK